MATQDKGTTEAGKGARTGGNGKGMQEPAALVREVYEAWNRREFDHALQNMSRDVKWLNVPFNKTYEGQDGARRWMSEWAAAMTDGKVEIKNLIANENGVVCEFIARGTHNGPLVGPQGMIPATNKRIDMAFSEHFDLRDGQIVAARMYFDSGTMMRQLGLMK